MRTSPLTLSLVLLFVVCAPADLLLLRKGADEVAWAFMVLGILCALGLAWKVAHADAQRNASTLEAERLHALAFQHASTSIWVEDWSEVGRTIFALRREGKEPALHLNKNPSLRRRLHESVRIIDVNDATLELLGAQSRQALVGSLNEVVPASAGTFDAWLAALARGDHTFRIESAVRHRDGSVRDCLVMASLPRTEADYHRLLVSILDVTDYKADQARLARAEREAARVAQLMTVGVLTGSIAHEVNNPLAATITNAEAALRWLRRDRPDTDEAASAIEGAIAAARRAEDVVDRTRRLVTRGSLVVESLDVSVALGAAVSSVARDLDGAGIELRIAVEPGTGPVRADPVRLHQVLINLLGNAARAMRPGAGERTIALEAMPHPDGVCIAVRDNGTGIPDAIRERLFEPFFTTRPDGMGLGLAVCRTCVEAHGGRLWLGGSPGDEGTTILFTLPSAAPA